MEQQDGSFDGSCRDQEFQEFSNSSPIRLAEMKNSYIFFASPSFSRGFFEAYSSIGQGRRN